MRWVCLEVRTTQQAPKEPVDRVEVSAGQRDPSRTEVYAGCEMHAVASRGVRQQESDTLEGLSASMEGRSSSREVW